MRPLNNTFESRLGYCQRFFIYELHLLGGPWLTSLMSFIKSRTIYNSPVSQLFPPSGEWPKQRVLAYKQNNQLPVVKQYVTNIAAIYSVGVL